SPRCVIAVVHYFTYRIHQGLPHRNTMTSAYILSRGVLLVTASTLLYVALTDLKEFKIRNELILVLVGLFFVHAVVSGRWVSMHWNIALAAVVLVVMIYFYAQNLMGGGDVKILAVSFLWVGMHCALNFAILMAVFAGAHGLAAKLGWV